MRWLASVSVVLTLSVATVADAAQRHAAPGGSGTACTEASPCGLATAIGSAVAGDDVLVHPGDYGSPASPLAAPLSNSAAIDVGGLQFQPRPRIFSAAGTSALELPNAGAGVTHLEIDNVGAGLAVDFEGSLAEGIVAKATVANACSLDGSAMLRNSICWTRSASANGVGALEADAVSLVGVTAVGGSYGAALNEAQYTISNSILVGQSADVISSGLMGSASIALDHSNYDAANTAGAGAVTPPGSGTNQNEPPLLANPAAGDFHQLAGSPTVDAGGFGSIGALDIDQGLRVVGAAPDIGADELVPAAATPPESPLQSTKRRKCKRKAKDKRSGSQAARRKCPPRKKRR